ncbi:caffeoylshikimate esterase-like [Triticum dicoccoides]|uniref:caffeoylshikimate esterase-like n=1 Tax=Triticum dicoccoides TaxID=85692 RepID=UPI000E7A1DB2|nr:caffeoylshikimate esterase-like [Triticum dicoccoides]
MVHPVAEADERSPFGRLTTEAYCARHGVTHSSSTLVNPRELRIFTQRWVPSGGAPVLGAIAVVHGFTGESSWMVLLTAVHFAKQGFAVAAVDHQGHGFSEGFQAHIPDIGPVLDDCEAGFAPFRADYPPPLLCFLYGESLSGAIALLLHPGPAARRH